MTNRLRALERRDLPELVQLCREHAEYERAPWREYERVAKLESLLLTSNDARCWVIDGEGELAGFASATLERSTWDAERFLYLDCLYLRPAYRGRGLGRELIARVAAAAVELGALDLQWQTPAWNEGAMRFYDRLGASRTDKLRYTLSAKQCTALLQTRASRVEEHMEANGHTLALDPEELQEGLVEAARLLRDFYAGLEQRRVAPSTGLDEIAHAFEGSLGEEGVGLRRALEDVEKRVLPHAMAVPHPLYLGLLNSSPLPGGIVAESIIGGLNNNSGVWQQAPPFVAAEQEVVRCFAELLRLPPETAGIVLPGGSYAALHALQLARDARLPAWRTEGARALSGDPRVYVSDAAHFSAVRAAQAVGVAPRDVVRVPSIDRGRIDANALATLLREDRERGALPFALVATLGTTGTGAMDSLPELVELSREFCLWLHVDACYGGAGALLEDLAQRFEGLDQADSVAVDPHKWFFTPMVAGLLLTRHTDLELQVFDVDASYIPTGERLDGFRRALPTSRRCSGFAVWMVLRAHGLAQVRAAVRRNVQLTRRLEEQLSQKGFRVLEGGELSIACARWEPAETSEEERNALQQRIATSIVESGDAWFGTVQAQGQSWLRFALVSTFTRDEHVDFLARRLAEVARSVSSHGALFK